MEVTDTRSVAELVLRVYEEGILGKCKLRTVPPIEDMSHRLIGKMLRKLSLIGVSSIGGKKECDCVNQNRQVYAPQACHK